MISPESDKCWWKRTLSEQIDSMMISDGKWQMLKKKKDFWQTSFKLVMISDWKADKKGVLANKDRNGNNFLWETIIRMKNSF